MICYSLLVFGKLKQLPVRFETEVIGEEVIQPEGQNSWSVLYS